MGRMRDLTIKKMPLHDSGESDDLKDKTPEQLLGMMWRLALDAWAFKENLNAEPRLQRHLVVLKKRRG